VASSWIANQVLTFHPRLDSRSEIRESSLPSGREHLVQYYAGAVSLRVYHSRGNCKGDASRLEKVGTSMMTDPQTNILGCLRPLYRFFQPDWRAVSWLVKLKSAWHLLLQNVSSAQTAAKSLFVDPRLKTSRNSAKGSKLSRKTSTGISAIGIAGVVRVLRR
jgi:hypothetical protein